MMSFGFSIGDLVSVSSLVFRVHDVLKQFNREGSSFSPEYYDLTEQVTELDCMYRAIERRGLGNLEEDSDVIIRTAKDIQIILTELEKFLLRPADPIDAGLPGRASFLFGDAFLWSSKMMKHIEKPMVKIFTARLKPVVSELQPLFPGVTPQTTLIGCYGTWPRPGWSPETGASSRNGPLAQTLAEFELIGAQGPPTSFEISSVIQKVTLPRGCILIMSMFAVFVALSYFLGVFFTLKKEYGYSMGDSFTLASYVVAVGAFISTAVLAYHYPRCKCWERGTGLRDYGIEMVSHLQLPEPD